VRAELDDGFGGRTLAALAGEQEGMSTWGLAFERLERDSPLLQPRRRRCIR
jgi:hypothetical protein